LFGGPIDAILPDMVQHVSKSAHTSAFKSKLATAGESYRGVTLQPMPGRSRFTDAQVRKAVDTAIEKLVQRQPRKF
jgi:hypothetical protein